MPRDPGHQKQHEPNWLPVSQLPSVADMIDGMYESASENHNTLLQAKEKPHVLDDATVFRAISVYQTQHDDMWLYREQLGRWQQGSLTPPQKQEVERLTAKLAEYTTLLKTILALLDELKQGTIDAVMRKSDVELGLEALLKQQKKDKRGNEVGE